MSFINNTSIQGSPFLVRSVTNEDKLFLNTDYCKSTISPYQDQKATGNSVTMKKNDTVFAALGEYGERFTLFHNLKRNIPKLDAFSLSENKVIKVSPSLVYLNYKLPGLRGFITDSSFSDSCGVASHLDSDSALKASILEFIERQSLITVWLAKLKMRKFNVQDINEFLDNDPYFKKNLKKFPNFAIYDISIYQGIYVILIVGANNKEFSIGLNSSLSLKKAILGALSEFEQTYEAMLVNNYRGIVDSTVDLYKYNFFNENPKSFLQKYSFLEDSKEKKISISDAYEDTIESLIKVLLSIPIDYYVTFITPEFYQTNIRITKVFSFKAYPHMYTKIINPYEIPLNKILGLTKFPNRGKIIPFP